MSGPSVRCEHGPEEICRVCQGIGFAPPSEKVIFALFVVGDVLAFFVILYLLAKLIQFLFPFLFL